MILLISDAEKFDEDAGEDSEEASWHANSPEAEGREDNTESQKEALADLDKSEKDRDEAYLKIRNLLK